MFQNMISDFIPVLDKSLTGGISAPVVTTFAPSNVVSNRATFSSSGAAVQMVLDAPTGSPYVLVSMEIYAYLSSSDPDLDSFRLWARTVVSSSTPTSADTGTNGDWFGFDNLTYISSTTKYGVCKIRVLVPNKQRELEVGELQYVQLAISNSSGEALNSSFTYKMRAHVEEYQFFQPMKG